MEFRELGTSGLRVGPLGLGSMTWGEGVDQAGAFRQMDLARAHGVNLIDCAELYPVPPSAGLYGETERIIGRWLRARGGRDRVVLASKAAGQGIEWIRHGQGFAGEGLRAALEGSLQRLGTDYLDLFQLHWPARRVPLFGVRNYQARWSEDDHTIEEAVAGLDRLLREGRVRAVGLSNETSWGLMRTLQACEAFGWRVASVQNAYNLVARRDEFHLSECLLRERVGYLAYAPLAGGLLTGKYRDGALPPGSRFAGWGAQRLTRYLNPGVDRAVDAYAALAQEYGIPLAEMVLSFTIHRPFLSSALVGASTEEQWRTAVVAAERVLPQELNKKIESCYRKHPDPAC